MGKEINKLKEDYKNKKEILFENKMFNSNDINYEYAYKNKLSQLLWKDRYLNKKPLKYTNKNEDIYIGYTHKNYDDAYKQLKNQAFKETNDTLSKEYIIYKDKNYLYIIGNFQTDFIVDNLYSLNSNIIKNIDFKEIKGIKLYNNLSQGKNYLNGLDINVTLDKDGSLTLDKNLNVEHNKPKLEIVLKKNESLDKTNKEHNEPKLDIISNDNLKDPKQILNSSKKIKKRKKAPSSLINKIGKIAIMASLVSLLGITTNTVISNLNNSSKTEMTNQTEVTSQSEIVETNENKLNYDNIKEGHQVFTNAYDAVNNTNSLQANEWFENNPVDVFDTTENSYMNLSHEQLNDSEFMAELAQNPDNAILLGNSIDDSSGFVKLDDVVTKVKKM